MEIMTAARARFLFLMGIFTQRKQVYTRIGTVFGPSCVAVCTRACASECFSSDCECAALPRLACTRKISSKPAILSSIEVHLFHFKHNDIDDDELFILSGGAILLSLAMGALRKIIQKR